MLYYLIGHWSSTADAPNPFSVQAFFSSVPFRTAAAVATAFTLCVLAGRPVIGWLGRRWRERIASDSPRLQAMHRAKQDTPTMGGLLVIGGTLAAAALWADTSNAFVLLGVCVLGGLGVLGVIDDLTKLAGTRRGLSEREKLSGQVLVALGVALGLAMATRGMPEGSRPGLFGAIGSSAFGWLLVPWAVLVITATTNGVNLADGLDGLAGGCYVFPAAAVAFLNYVAGNAELAERLAVPYVPGGAELTVLLGAAIGATLGFLWFNCHPAEVFLGDTGSLALGGLLGYAALVPRQELLLVVAGGVFVAEAASVLVQRYYFKATGRRVLLCAPLHHHYQFLGWPENRIVVRFWIIAAFLSLLAVATLRLR